MMGKRIQERLAQLNLKQVELARLIGVAPSEVNRYVKGVRTPEGVRLHALARVLKVKPSWLRDED